MHSDTPQKMSQKEVVKAWLNLVVSGEIRKAYDKYVHPDFRHHNQYFKGDKETLIAGMEESDAQFPKKVFEIKKIVEEGDMVMAFSSMKLSEEMPAIAVVHIFRFEDNQIIELWDVAQPQSKDSPNENGMF